MDQYKHIENLLERFFDGYTTNEEENELYTFFSSKDVPEYLIKYKAVFKYFDSQLKEEGSPTPENIYLLEKPSKNKKLWTTIISIAASVLIIFSVHHLYSQDKFDPYEGSYIIENGVKITNIDQIKDQLEEVEKAVLERQAEAEKLIEKSLIENSFSTEEEQSIIDQHYSFLDSIQNENLRNEIRNSLNN